MGIKKELSYSKMHLLVLVAMFSEPSGVTQSWTKDIFFSLFFLEGSSRQGEQLNPQSFDSPGCLVKQISKQQE